MGCGTGVSTERKCVCVFVCRTRSRCYKLVLNLWKCTRSNVDASAVQNNALDSYGTGCCGDESKYVYEYMACMCICQVVR